MASSTGDTALDRNGLSTEARLFADHLSDILNGTVCDGIRLSVVELRGGDFLVGYGLRADDVISRGIPVRIGRQSANLWLDINYRLAIDDRHEHSMVRSSVVLIAADEDLESELIHFDYERDKPDGYPEAHIQVAASSRHWASVLQPSGRILAKLHLPVGGRRYRPTLEDIIEFMVVERLATPREGWKVVLETARDDFERKQLQAAVRRAPEAALDQLTGMGYRLIPHVPPQAQGGRP